MRPRPTMTSELADSREQTVSVLFLNVFRLGDFLIRRSCAAVDNGAGDRMSGVLLDGGDEREEFVFRHAIVA